MMRTGNLSRNSPTQPALRTQGACRLSLRAAWLAVPALLGCPLEPYGDDDGSTVEVPAQVAVAFDEACGKTNCHSGSAPDRGLDLTPANIDAIMTANGRNGMPLVRIGDTKGSLIAIKMMSSDVLAALDVTRPGGIMPPTVALDDGDEAHVATILAWIAGATFDDPTTGGDATTDGDAGSTDE